MEGELVVAMAMKLLAIDPLGSGLAASNPSDATLTRRIDTTLEMLRRKRRGATSEINLRTGVQALVDAALTDDVVIHEYLAGITATASDMCDNAHLLSLVRRLSPYQLRWHYMIYLATVSLVRDEPDAPGDWRGVWTRAHIAFESDFIFEVPGSSHGPLEVGGLLSCYEALEQLEREGLIRMDDSLQYFEGMIAFRITLLGAELLATATGLGEADLEHLCLTHPESLILDSSIQNLSVDWLTKHTNHFLIKDSE